MADALVEELKKNMDTSNFFEISDVNDICFVEDDSVIKNLIGGIEKRGQICQLKAMRVFVYTREGENIPHFHIIRKGVKDCCLKIKECDWFIHGKNNNKITKKELELLHEWLIKDDKKYWKKIISEWNKGKDEKMKIPNDTDIPEYSKLK